MINTIYCDSYECLLSQYCLSKFAKKLNDNKSMQQLEGRCIFLLGKRISDSSSKLQLIGWHIEYCK
jgi:hypothetical protein